MSGNSDALKGVPLSGYDSQGNVILQTGTIIDVNKSIGAKPQDMDWQSPETGYKTILEKGYDIADPSSGDYQQSSLQNDVVLQKESLQKNSALPNEALADGESRAEHQLTDEEKMKLQQAKEKSD